MTFRLSIVLSATVSLAALAAAETARAQDAGTTQLEQIEVEGEGQGARQGGGAGAAAQPGPPTTGTPGVATSDGYVAKTTRTGTKTDLPVNETPVTINTVTQKQIDDRRPQNLLEALAYTPGASVGVFGFDPRFDAFYIRGVEVTYTGVFRDGLRQFNSPNGVFRLEPYGLESISILKGPASAIYGASSSAGIVDLISKRPKDYKFGEIEAQTGSFDRIQGNFDVGGPLNDEGSVLWRLTGVARDAKTEISAIKDDRVFVAPAVTFKPSDDTKITLLGEYMDSTTSGTAAYLNSFDGSNSTGVLPIYGGDKRFNDFEQKQGRAGYEFEHRFADSFAIHQNLRYSALDTRQEYAFASFPGLIKEDVRAIAVDTYLKGNVETGPVRHALLAGIDVGHSKYKSRQGFGADPFTEDFFYEPDITIKNKQTQTLTGAYLQDILAVDRWRLMLGGRHDWLDSDFRAGTIADGYGEAQKQKEGEFTGRAALSYVTPQGFTPYVSYGTSFVPNPGTIIGNPDDPESAGSVAKPTKGEIVEGGVKYAVPGTNAAINASVFSLTQKDGIVFAVDGGANVQTQLDFRTRGFEIEGTASLANGVNLLANYSYTDTKVLELADVPEAKGNQLSSIPKHAFALWAGYDVKTGPLNGLGLGAGVRYSGFSEGDLLNRSIISNKPRAFVDGKLSYDLGAASDRLKGLSLQVNATNLLDDVKQLCTNNYCYYDKGRQVIASVRYRW